MPRTVLRNPYKEAAELVFGARGERKVAYIADKAQIPQSTCCRYRDNIDKMPLERFAKVCRVLRLTDAQIAEVIRTLGE